MKRLATFAFLLSLTFISCSKNEDTNPVSTSQLNSTVTAGSWRVTYYWDKDHDETSNFTGYAFTFNSNNTITATKGSSTIAGTWTTGTDDSKLKLILGFSSPADFAEISDDWEVIERTNTRIKLQDVSGGGGGTDLLTFESN